MRHMIISMLTFKVVALRLSIFSTFMPFRTLIFQPFWEREGESPCLPYMVLINLFLEFKRDTWQGCFVQNITIWIVYLSITNLSHRSFFPGLSLLMLLLVNAPCTILINYWVFSSFYYVWLICIYSYSSWVMFCTLVSLQDSIHFSCLHNASSKVSNYTVLLSRYYFIPHTCLPFI